MSKILTYSELTSPFIQPKALFHTDRMYEIAAGAIPAPVTCEIDLTDGFCNNNCKYCFFDTNSKKNPVLMDTTKVKELLQELYEGGVRGIEFSGGGEPTTHPDFEEIVEYAAKLGVALGLVTNGLFLDRVFSVASKFTFIRISLDAGTEETYRVVHGSDTFDVVINNIRHIAKYMNMMKLGIAFLIVEENIEDILPASYLAKELGCRYIQYRPASLLQEVDSDVWRKAQEEVSKALQLRDKNFQIFDAGVKWKHLDGERCYEKCMTSSLVSVVKANGDIPLCVLKRNEGNSIIGNIYDGGFFKQWNSPRHRMLIENNNLLQCRMPCKHDSYNIAYEACMKDYYHANFI